MPDPLPQPPESQPGDTTQTHDLDALQMTQGERPELPMFERLPAASDEPTQPIPVSPLGPSAEAVQALLNGPEVRIQAGAPPESAPLFETQILHPDVQTRRIAPGELPLPPRKRMPLWGWATLVLLLGLGTVYFLRPELLGFKTAEAPESEPDAKPGPQEAATTEVPPALRSYLEKAQQGDKDAMRMLGVMYYNGLNVQRNQEEGLKWYRKAAAAGSVAAQKELKALEGKTPSR